ncbi:hypothetical protein N9B82_00190 [Saprospiraceae bacterium]|nr:hypothetical protein [Saprospiraceae bacterium]
MKKKDITVEEMLSFFPELELPITLTEESALDFSNHNKALPFEALAKFILPYEDVHDDLTEYVPCFRLENTINIHVLVYWKASLMNYEYKMMTIDQTGQFIDGKVIAGILSNGETIIRTVSTIDEDWIIHSVVGEENPSSTTPNTASKAFNLELLATGEIIFSLNEKDNE